jgi:hypothetical protein
MSYLRACETCGRETSANARWCPGCGQPDPHGGYHAQLEAEAEARRHRVFDENQRRIRDVARRMYPGALAVSLSSVLAIQVVNALTGRPLEPLPLAALSLLLALPLGFALGFILGTNDSPLERKDFRVSFDFFAPCYAAALVVEALAYTWWRVA